VGHLKLDEAKTALSNKGQMLMILPKLNENSEN
jgi:hypothetical protein